MFEVVACLVVLGYGLLVGWVLVGDEGPAHPKAPKST